MARPRMEQLISLNTSPLGSDGLPQGKRSADEASLQRPTALGLSIAGSIICSKTVDPVNLRLFFWSLKSKMRRITFVN